MGMLFVILLDRPHMPHCALRLRSYDPNRLPPVTRPAKNSSLLPSVPVQGLTPLSFINMAWQPLKATGSVFRRDASQQIYAPPSLKLIFIIVSLPPAIDDRLPIIARCSTRHFFFLQPVSIPIPICRFLTGPLA